MEFDFDTVREVIAPFVNHHVPVRHQEQAFAALEKKVLAFVSCLKVQMRAAASKRESIIPGLLLYGPSAIQQICQRFGSPIEKSADRRFMMRFSP